MIGLDARLLHHTGIGRYLRGLVAALGPADLVAWVAPQDLAAAAALWPGLALRPCPAPVFSVREQLFWRRELRELPLRLLHVPHFNVPLGAPVPLVVTLHDLIPLRFPGTMSPLGTLYFRLMSAHAARVARRVIVPSRATAADVERFLGVQAAVVPQGVEPGFAVPAGPSPVAGRYVLYAGQWKRYKNVEGLLAAFAGLGPELADVKLVLAGRVDARAAHVPAAIARLGLAGRVVLPGYLPDDQLLALLQGARALAFPSRCEGFGLPPLEAMAAGVPVVSSDAASLPEVVGEAGLLLDPDDTAGWTAALARSIADEPLRARLIAAGRERAAGFPWARTAALTREVYGSVSW